MPQIETPAAAKTSAVPGAGGMKKKKKGMGRGGKAVLAIVILAAIAAAVAAAVYMLVFREEDTRGAVMTESAVRGSIQSVVEGNGTTSAKDSAVVTPEAGGIVEELFVREGDHVNAGDPLYTMDDTKAREQVTAIQKEYDDAGKAVSNCRKELQTVYDSISELTIRAPHDGKLMEVSNQKIGSQVSGDKLATLVNDTRMRLILYYSYAYEGQIAVGQSAEISLPAVMGSFSGKVEEVSYVRRVVPEGGVMFEVSLLLDNPGTLTAGMEASARMTAADGTEIYPYENGKLEFYEVSDIMVRVNGPVEQFNMRNYEDVKAGQVLAQLGRSTQDEEIAGKELALQSAQDRLKEAEEKLNSARETLQNYNAVAPIAGTVLACTLVPGEEVQSGQAITIADTSIMTIKITVDERHIQYVKPGMWVDIDQWGNYFGGVVESVSQIANAENGVAQFPAIVKVDNPDGQLMSNMYVNYSFVASQSEDCLTVPIQAVRYVSMPDGIPDNHGVSTDQEEIMPEGDGIAAEESVPGEPVSEGDMGEPMPDMMERPGRPGAGDENTATVVFVQADNAPESAITDPDPAWECPDGFWTVPVRTGLADNTSVEILEGLNEGDVVFIGYETQQADNWG